MVKVQQQMNVLWWLSLALRHSSSPWGSAATITQSLGSVTSTSCTASVFASTVHITRSFGGSASATLEAVMWRRLIGKMFHIPYFKMLLHFPAVLLTALSSIPAYTDHMTLSLALVGQACSGRPSIWGMSGRPHGNTFLYSGSSCQWCHFQLCSSF